jgi:hypothetical protein
MASNRPLPGDLTVTGMDQASMYAWFANATDLINELKADHATYKTTIDDQKTLINLLQHRSQNFILHTSPALAIDTNFDVKNTETTVFVAGSVVYTLTDNTSCDTGTTKTITASLWGAFAVEASNATTLAANWASGSYASEALALAAAKALTPTANKCVIGFVTVNAHGSGFTAGTDALTTGTGGNVATATNYYSQAVPVFTAVSSSSPAALSNSTDLTLARS